MKKLFFTSLLLALCAGTFAQEQVGSDSFLYKKRKGLFGKAIKSIMKSDTSVPRPVKSVNAFLKFRDLPIRRIEIIPLPFNMDPRDSSKVRTNFLNRIADGLHRDTRIKVVRKFLFFKEGDEVNPFLISDNARYLREQEFLQDALIKGFKVKGEDGRDMVDIQVITRDVFSIGGSANISSAERGVIELREENTGGYGNRFLTSFVYDKNRSPTTGYGAEFTKRNIVGSFVNGTIGATTKNRSFNSGNLDEMAIYSVVEKPLVSRYTELTGAAELSLNHSASNYFPDTTYKKLFKYSMLNGDLWLGYNFGALSGKKTDAFTRLRHFAATRFFYKRFFDAPDAYNNVYNYNYANMNGWLVSYSLFKQNFYRTNFIYGFGRNEDVPFGVNASLTAGITSKQGVRRPYYGAEFTGAKFADLGYYGNYYLKVGGFTRNSKFEDVDIILGTDFFTRLRNMGGVWRHRAFINTSLTEQANAYLNVPLFLGSNFGLPYHRNGSVAGSFRATAKLENVFYNIRKYWGFRFAPFVFTDAAYLKPINKIVEQKTFFAALGAGVRARNESLIFGTMEAKAYYFPTPIAGMKNYRFSFGTNLRFRYNSSFIKRPDFIVVN